ncbi:M81 family metallopeptidase [Ramlibacter albus]|uniref:Microcystinase C n=1 Tax=Ramlibacter albus TaxID=2079448 RepID=A0A923S1L1_9BURK|nr:M81 family metallopeptidase [Ramlibacter albus]MBC5764539.1 M81 family metallopeptidase [Ramlibacter albus]
MTRILVAGYQHETNTFAPSLADWAAFTRGDSFPEFTRGAAMVERLRGINIPVAGFLDAARSFGWECVPSCWAGAIPSSYVTKDAFERIAATICEDVKAACAQAGGLDAIYLDLHGAAVAEHAADSEGELLGRLRAIVGPKLPIVASLDLHANVTRRMLAEADAMVSYRTYPHVDMAETGARAAELLKRRLHAGRREPMHSRRVPYLIPLNAQSTWLQPAQGIYEELAALDRRYGTLLSFCPGFPASDFAECAPMVWGHGHDEPRTREAVEALYARAAEPTQWRQDILPARDAVARAMALAEHSDRPVVVADTQDNPGAGGDSNTTGMLHALLAQGAGRRYPGQVALGLMFDADAARTACDAGVGATLDLALGRAVPTFTGQPSDPPVQGRFTVRAVSNGRVTIKGPMMTGLSVALGPSACLEIDGVQIAVVSGKKQLMDRELLRMVGIQAEQQRIIVAKSSNHFRADFTPIASHVLVAKAAGPMAAEPSDLPWRHLPPEIRRAP